MKKLLLYLLLFFCLFVPFQRLQASSFNGIQWVSVDTSLQKSNQWLCFRKTFSLSRTVSGIALMSIAVDSKYWLWINGNVVVYEGGLKRGPNPDDTYYDHVDVTKYLHKGKNTIAIMVWYFGKDGFCHKSSGMSGLLVRLSAGGKIIVTDSTWKVKVHPSFGDTGDPHPNYRLPESNVYFDARKDIDGWYLPDYNDKLWAKATVLGRYPCQPWNKLVARPFPNWKYSAMLKYDSVTVSILDGKTEIRGKLPRNITVTPYIKLKAKAGQRIDIRSDNYKGGSEYNVRAEYITKDGIQSFEMPNYINGHHIIYKLPAGVHCLEVGYRETRFCTEHIGNFKCDDDFYNKLWWKALNTMNLNMRDAIQDPDRERSQWWGDAAIILHEIFYSCDGNGAKAVKKAILNLVDWQKSDGVLFSPVPAGSWDKELPLQMLASIGKYGFWSYYQYTADTACIKYVYPHVKKYLSLWQLDANGLVVHRGGGWDWGDWGNDIDISILDNAWYCLALESAIGMAHIAGDIPQAKDYQSQLDIVRRASSAAFWNGGIFRSKDYKGKTDDRANAMAVLAGFSESEKNKKVVEFLMTNANSSPYMEKYVLESLFSNGFINEALERMKSRYTNMVNSNLTTLWEDWVIGGSGGGSINHGWAGSPLNLLSEYVGGVTPYEPGWKTILVKPQLGRLHWVDCTVPVEGKTITVKAKQTESEWSVSIDNATGKDCVLAIPVSRMGDGRLLYVNGELVAHTSHTISDNRYFIKSNNMSSDYIFIKLRTRYLTVKIN